MTSCDRAEESRPPIPGSFNTTYARGEFRRHPRVNSLSASCTRTLLHPVEPVGLRESVPSRRPALAEPSSQGTQGPSEQRIEVRRVCLGEFSIECDRGLRCGEGLLAMPAGVYIGLDLERDGQFFSIATRILLY